MDKISLRRECLDKRRGLSSRERETLSQTIREKVESRPEFQEARVVALYYPTAGEVDLLPLAWILLAWGKRVVFPRVEAKELVFCPVEGEGDLREGYKGIKEPITSPISQEEIDLFLVPGVAYDLEGYRLGMGGGFYDKVLSRKGRWQMALGAAYHFQIVDRLPRDWWDQRVDLVITENLTLTPATTRYLKRR